MACMARAFILDAKKAAYNKIYFTGNSDAYDTYNTEDSIVNAQE